MWPTHAQIINLLYVCMYVGILPALTCICGELHSAAAGWRCPCCSSFRTGRASGPCPAGKHAGCVATVDTKEGHRHYQG